MSVNQLVLRMRRGPTGRFLVVVRAIGVVLVAVLLVAAGVVPTVPTARAETSDDEPGFTAPAEPTTQLTSADMRQPIPPPPAEPDLVARLMPPTTGSSNGTTSLVGSISNIGIRSPPTTAEILVSSGAEAKAVARLEIPSLGPGEVYSLSHVLRLPPGLSKATVIADSGDRARESTEENNIATTWVLVDRHQPVGSASAIRFENARGERESPAEWSHKWENGNLTVKIQSRPSQSLRLLIMKAWLDSRLGSPAFSGADLGVMERGNDPFYVAELRPGQYEIQATSFVPDPEPRFTRGALDSVLLEDRPMRIRLAQTPSHPPPVLRQTPNETFEDTADPVTVISVSFEAGSSGGQPVWFAVDWLRKFGIENPDFRHEDGSPIKARRVGDFFVARPAHFSEIHIFNSGNDNFELVSDQNWSFVGYEAAGGGRMRIYADRGDKLDESRVRDFVPHEQYNVSAKFGITQRGNWQMAYPLGIGNRTEREAPLSTENYWVSKSFGFRYWSRDDYVGLGQPEGNPTVDAYYTNQNGDRIELWQWKASADAGWVVNMKIIVTGTSVTMELRNTAGALQTCVSGSCTATFDKTELLPTRYYDVLFVATEDTSTDAWEPEAIGWVDDIRVDVTQGNFVNEDFITASGTQLVGSAVCCASGVLQLNPNTPGLAGLAPSRSDFATTRFSAEFRYRIGPNASGGEGLVFAFFKQMEYMPAPGSTLGFEDAEPATTLGHAGYGLELDARPNKDQVELLQSGAHIALIQDRASNHLWAASEGPLADGNWHVINMDVLETKLHAYHDGRFIGTAEVRGFDRTFGGLGFSASSPTAGASVDPTLPPNYHEVDYVRVSVPEDLPPTPNCSAAEVLGLVAAKDPVLARKACEDAAAPLCPVPLVAAPGTFLPPSKPIRVALCPTGPVAPAGEVPIIITLYQFEDAPRVVSGALWTDEVVQIVNGATFSVEVQPRVDHYVTATVRLPPEGVAYFGVNASIPGAWQVATMFFDLDAKPPSWGYDDPREREPVSTSNGMELPFTSGNTTIPSWIRPDGMPTDRPDYLRHPFDFVGDQDGDGVNGQTEVQCGANLMVTLSTCMSDDDSDGVPNNAEWADPILRSGCSGAYGIVLAAACGGYWVPATCPTSFALACPGPEADRVYAWDPLCTPAQTGNYSGCRDSSNRDGASSTSKYAHDNGWGFRFAATGVSVYSVYPCYAQDGDSDGLVRIVLCAREGYFTADGQFHPTGQEHPVTEPIGDPNDSDASVPVGLEEQGGPQPLASDPGSSASGSQPDSAEGGIGPLSVTKEPNSACTARGDSKVRVELKLWANNDGKTIYVPKPDFQKTYLPYTKIEIYERHNDWNPSSNELSMQSIAIFYTDQDGFAGITLDNFDGANFRRDLSIRIYADSKDPWNRDGIVSVKNFKDGEKVYSSLIHLKWWNPTTNTRSYWEFGNVTCRYEFVVSETMAAFYMMAEITRAWKITTNAQSNPSVSGYNAPHVDVLYYGGELAHDWRTCSSTCYKIIRDWGFEKIFIDARFDAGDQWDRDVLLHEYGHHMHAEMGDNELPQGAGGDHSFGQCYNNGLTFTEGFANFLSAAWQSGQRSTWNSLNQATEEENRVYYQDVRYKKDAYGKTYGEYAAKFPYEPYHGDDDEGDTACPKYYHSKEESVMSTFWDIWDMDSPSPEPEGPAESTVFSHMQIMKVFWGPPGVIQSDMREFHVWFDGYWGDNIDHVYTIHKWGTSGSY